MKTVLEYFAGLNSAVSYEIFKDITSERMLKNGSRTIVCAMPGQKAQCVVVHPMQRDVPMPDELRVYSIRNFSMENVNQVTGQLEWPTFGPGRTVIGTEKDLLGYFKRMLKRHRLRQMAS
jgi:hypothetical protein